LINSEYDDPAKNDLDHNRGL